MSTKEKRLRLLAKRAGDLEIKAMSEVNRGRACHFMQRMYRMQGELARLEIPFSAASQTGIEMKFCTARVAPEEAVIRPALPMQFMPGMTEMHMTTLTFKQQILHPNWQRRRLEILKRDDFCCTKCYDKDSILHVHHKRYVKGRLYWEYKDHELTTLCDICHSEAHAEADGIKEILSYFPSDGPGCSSDVLHLLAGWANAHHKLEGDAYLQAGPNEFAAGQIAARLAFTPIDDLFALANALSRVPYWVVGSQIPAFVKALIDNAEMPYPRPDESEEL